MMSVLRLSSDGILRGHEHIGRLLRVERSAGAVWKTCWTPQVGAAFPDLWFCIADVVAGAILVYPCAERAACDRHIIHIFFR